MKKYTIAVLLFVALPLFAQEEARLLRFPAIHDDQLVFTYAGDLYSVAATGGIARKLTNHPGYEMFARFSPDDQKMAYNRVFREFRTWKRYRGGMADDIWIYDLATKQIENITNNPAQDIMPMWAGNKIYFLFTNIKSSGRRIAASCYGNRRQRQKG